MCIECSGIHRNFGGGAHVSQVRSIFMDCLSHHHIHRIMQVGNHKFNQERETDKEKDPDKEKFIVRKYLNCFSSNYPVEYMGKVPQK